MVLWQLAPMKQQTTTLSISCKQTHLFAMRLDAGIKTARRFGSQRVVQHPGMRCRSCRVFITNCVCAFMCMSGVRVLSDVRTFAVHKWCVMTWCLFVFALRVIPRLHRCGRVCIKRNSAFQNVLCSLDHIQLVFLYAIGGEFRHFFLFFHWGSQLLEDFSFVVSTRDVCCWRVVRGDEAEPAAGVTLTSLSSGKLWWCTDGLSCLEAPGQTVGPLLPSVPIMYSANSTL